MGHAALHPSRGGLRRQGAVLRQKRAGSSKRRSPMQQLQRKAGNEALGRLMAAGGIQAKLTVNRPGDAYEREADRVADQVVRQSEPGAGPVEAASSSRPPQIQRMCPGCEEELNRQSDEGKEEEEVQRQAMEGEEEEEAQRQAMEGEEEEVQRQAMEGEEKEEEGEVMTKPKAGGRPHVSSGLASRIQAMRGGGRPLPGSVRGFFQRGFGRDFGAVRIHTDSAADQAARSLNARAFTLGRDVVFRSGEYSPDTPGGKRLLAHELTHVVQQGSSRPSQGGAPTLLPSPHRASPMIAPKWIVEKPERAVPKGGKKNKELLLAAFQKICPLVKLVRKGGDQRLEMGAGKVTPNRKVGCGCLATVERDVEKLEKKKPSRLKKVPRIEVSPQSWSFTVPDANAPRVNVRHPVDPYKWGYWTVKDRRTTKGFFRTVAHEVCGHMVPFILKIPSGRSSKRGHNEAIIRENLVAAEHKVPGKEFRGLDKPEKGKKAGKHRGESFLQAAVGDFGHASSIPPASLKGIIASGIGTIRNFTATLEDRLRIQLEGFGYKNEGGSMAQQRISAVKAQFKTELKKNSINLTTQATGKNRFGKDIATVLAGKSVKGAADNKRTVHVYLFHKPAGEGS